MFSIAAVPIILSEITDLSDEGRDKVIFTCQAVGEPVPDISWYFNDVMINVSDNSSKYMIVSNSLNATTTENTLTVYNATSADVGVYSCTASNILGNDTSFGETLYCYIIVVIAKFCRLSIWYGISNMWCGNKLRWLQHCWQL